MQESWALELKGKDRVSEHTHEDGVFALLELHADRLTQSSHQQGRSAAMALPATFSRFSVQHKVQFANPACGCCLHGCSDPSWRDEGQHRHHSPAQGADSSVTSLSLRSTRSEYQHEVSVLQGERSWEALLQNKCPLAQEAAQMLSGCGVIPHCYNFGQLRS